MGSSNLETSASARTSSLLTANTGRLRRFLANAGQAVEILCTENLMHAAGAADALQLPNALPFSERHTLLQLHPALGDRSPHDLAFDSTGGGLLVAYGKPTDAEPPTEHVSRKRDVAALKRLATGGFLALWKVYALESPWALMRCAGVPSCCMLPETKPHLAFAGTEEGSVQLWNLREPGSAHPSVELAGTADRLALRSPTYASDCLASGAHMSPIVALAALPTSVDIEEASLSISSLDVEGTLIVWLVLEAVELDALDLGQAVGGKERLLLSGTSNVSEGSAAASRRAGGAAGSGASVLPTRCVQLAFVPEDPSRLLVATDLPAVLHRSRYSAVPPVPDSFPCDSTGPQNASGVASVAFHPSATEHFLAGRRDGSVSLYHIDDTQPLLTYVGFTSGAVVQLAWSPSRPALFWVLDSDDCMYLFDLVEASGAPVVSTPLASTKRADSPTRLAPSSTSSRAANGDTAGDAGEAHGRLEATRPMRFALDARTDASTVTRGSAGARQRLMALTVRDGKRLSGVEVHVLTESYAAAVPDEQTKLDHVLAKL